MPNELVILLRLRLRLNLLHVNFLLTSPSGMTSTLEIYNKVSSPLVTSLLTTHPNQVTLGGGVPDAWSSWWDWAAEYDQGQPPKWMQLLEYYCRPVEKGDPSPSIPSWQIPPQLCGLIDTVRDLQLSREPIYSVLQGSPSFHINRRLTRVALAESQHLPHGTHKTRGRSPTSFGMSPKKEHEVFRMASFIRNLIKRDARHVQHAVDVGSGQVSTSISLLQFCGSTALLLTRKKGVSFEGLAGPGPACTRFGQQ